MSLIPIFVLLFCLILYSYSNPSFSQRGEQSSHCETADLKCEGSASICAEATSNQTASDPQSIPVTGEPDVLLNVPKLSVGSIDLEVDNLDVKLNLAANVLNLVTLSAGVAVSVDKVKLTISDVEASALLVVRLNNVREILSRTLDTIDKNPQIIETLVNAVGNVVGDVGNTVGDVVGNVGNAAGGVV